ncbi:putative YigZ family protein [Thermosipho japonicus]|uniref:Putative YigZ family protein n=1 Tax=Thermosipho japonicus TaxID=90323 RepID=A0A841GQS2_9BACT|nr:YigZ family protein [Thermosipho japonicus]MBB6061989.1 putative YigZ family protein [Thermosipho japonicus]
MNYIKYKTIFGVHEHKKNIERSIFIATLSHIKNQEEAKEFIREISKKYNDATHNCPAYRVIENNQIIEFSSDNGEPSGTAGRPILGVLKRYDLLNVVVVVTRYFGGVKLGVRGLIEAYSSTVDELISNLKVTTLVPIPVYTVKIGYDEYGKAMQDLHYKGYEIINTEFFETFAHIKIRGNKKPEEYNVLDESITYIKEEE